MIECSFNQETHQYFDRSGKRVPCASDILEHFGISNIEDVRGFIGDKAVEASAEFGQNVHATMSLYDLGELESCDPHIEPYLNGWKKYLESVRPQFIAIELPLMSEIWNVAGTPDRVTRLTIPDIKTGAITIAEAIQTAIYKIIVDESLKVKIKERYSVHLSPNVFKIIQHKDNTDINIAKALINLFNYKIKKGLIKGW